MQQNTTKVIALAAATLFIGSTALAGTLGVAENYNAFIFHDMNQKSDSQGALAVGGNLTLTNYSVASNLGSSTTNLVVGGNLSFTGGSIHGTAVVGGNTTMKNGGPSGDLFTAGNYSGNNGPSGTVYYGGTYSGPSWVNHQAVASVTLPFDFAAAESELLSTSTSLSNLADTGSMINSYDTLTFTGTSAGLNVFSVDAGTLASANGIHIDLPANAFALVNVTGSTSVTLPNVGFWFNSSAVLWNLNGVTNLSMHSFSGSILAPSANVNFASGQLNGTLVASDLYGGGELHNTQFSHDIGLAVPLPTSAGAGAVLLAGVALARHRRRSTRS